MWTSLFVFGLALGSLKLIAVLSRRRLAELQTLVSGSRILLSDEMANCLGVESRGRVGVRGNGCLALINTEIVFLLHMPR